MRDRTRHPRFLGITITSLSNCGTCDHRPKGAGSREGDNSQYLKISLLFEIETRRNWILSENASWSRLLRRGIAMLILGVTRSAKRAVRTLAPTQKGIPGSSPKSLQQVGVTVEATRAAIRRTIRRTPEKISLPGQKLFFGPSIVGEGTVSEEHAMSSVRLHRKKPTSVGIKGREGGGGGGTTQTHRPFETPSIIRSKVMGRPGEDARGAAALPMSMPLKGRPNWRTLWPRSQRLESTGKPSARLRAGLHGPDLLRAMNHTKPRTQLPFDYPFDSLMSPATRTPLTTRPKRGGSSSTLGRCNNCQHADTQRDVTVFTDKDFHKLGIVSFDTTSSRARQAKAHQVGRYGEPSIAPPSDGHVSARPLSQYQEGERTLHLIH